MSGGDVTAGKLLLVEYERVKEEQKVRIGFRDNLIYATLASNAAVIAATLSGRGQVDLLLLLPAVAVLLGWTYLVNDIKVSAAGKYIRTELSPKISALVPDVTSVLAWESFHRSDPRRRTRKILQLAVDLSIFCMAPTAALVIFWVSGPQISTLIVSIVEICVIALLAVQIILYADLQNS